jgi:hypothetical protein
MPIPPVSNDLLVHLYHKALQYQCDKDFIEMVFKEIKHRNLRLDRVPRKNKGDVIPLTYYKIEENKSWKN